MISKATGVQTAAAVVLTVLGGCSGGGPTTGGGGGGGSRALSPKTGPLTEAEARHFLLRTSFGTKPSELARLLRVGLRTYVDEMLEFTDDPVLEASAMRVFADRDHPKQDSMVRWWLHLMVHTENPTREHLALFWHDLFATSHVNMSNGQRWWMRDHVNLLRKHGNGNLRDLFHRLTKDQAMLFWLDGYKSSKDRPNENFGREFWELFSLGRDNAYTQADIEESSRAFTGYELRLNQQTGQWFMRWNASRHDDSNKTIFGQTGNWGYDDVVDLTLERRRVAEYVCTKLFEHYCHDDPNTEIVDELSAILRGGGWELRPVLSRLLESNAMFSPASRTPRVKSPIEYVVGFVRTTGLAVPLDTLDKHLAILGQRPTLPPGVEGWPQGIQWLGAAAMMQRSNAINAIVTARGSQAGFAARIGRLVPDTKRNTKGIIEVLAGLLAIDAAPEDKALWRRYLDSEARSARGKLVLAPSRFDWLDNRHIDERLRGLLHVMTQHPSYHTR